MLMKDGKDSAAVLEVLLFIRRIKAIGKCNKVLTRSQPDSGWGRFVFPQFFQHRYKGEKRFCKAIRNYQGSFFVYRWCRRRDLNSQGHKARRILSPLRLPIPPLRQNIFYVFFYEISLCLSMKLFNTGEYIIL